MDLPLPGADSVLALAKHISRAAYRALGPLRGHRQRHRRRRGRDPGPEAGCAVDELGLPLGRVRRPLASRILPRGLRGLGQDSLWFHSGGVINVGWNMTNN